MPEEAVFCKHHEKIEEFHHYALGTCTQCGQVKRYDRLYYRQPPKKIKIGRINGVPTLTHPKKESIKMTQNDTEVASTAQLDTVAKIDPAAGLSQEIPSLPKAKQPHIRKRAKKCKKCQFYKIHGDTPWCTSKKCPSRYPPELRPPFRSPETAHPEKKAPAQSKAASDTKVTKVNKDNRLVSLGTFTVGVASELPDFPDFDSKWAFPVQEKWLATYLELRTLEVIGCGKVSEVLKQAQRG